MPISESQYVQLQTFFNQSEFASKGAVITDLDGTAIHEYEGRYSIPQSVELGLEKLYNLGRPVVLNTLRFPLSVIRTFGKEWYKISKNPIPVVLLNGSQLGFITQDADGNFAFEELDSFPVGRKEVTKVLNIIRDFTERQVDNLLAFYYPRDWTKGEIIWTPVESRIDEVSKKYRSASKVFTSDIETLEAKLLEESICMVFLLINLPQDKLMAYQHTIKSNFITREGVDKLSGAEHIAAKLQFELQHSLGAGDSDMDTFLKGVGQAVHVRNPYLKYHGLLPPICVTGSAALGELLFNLAAMQKTVVHA